MSETLTPLDYARLCLDMAESRLTEPYVDVVAARRSIHYARQWLTEKIAEDWQSGRKCVTYPGCELYRGHAGPHAALLPSLCPRCSSDVMQPGPETCHQFHARFPEPPLSEYDADAIHAANMSRILGRPRESDTPLATPEQMRELFPDPEEPEALT